MTTSESPSSYNVFDYFDKKLDNMNATYAKKTRQLALSVRRFLQVILTSRATKYSMISMLMLLRS